MNSLGKLWKGGHHGDLVDLGMFLGDLARYKNLLWWWGDGKMESIGKLWKGGHHGDFGQHAMCYTTYNLHIENVKEWFYILLIMNF